MESSKCTIMGRPRIRWRTLGIWDCMRLPNPPAIKMTMVSGVSGIFSIFCGDGVLGVVERFVYILFGGFGWGGG